MEVTSKLQKIARGEYADYIDQMAPGAAMRITSFNWTRRESIYHYFLTRFKGRVSVRRVDQGVFYVIKTM